MRISTNLFNQRGLSGILDQQSGISSIQQKIASGKRINKPSDDPMGSSQVLRLRQAKSLTEQYQRNITQLINRQTMEEDVLSGVEGSLLRVRELALQANNSGLTDPDRQAIATEVELRLDELLGLANTRDSNGEYLFSGFQTNTKPFSQLVDGSFSYNADQGHRELKVSDERTIADGDSGLDIFMDIVSGNGHFIVQDNLLNSGSGIIDPGSVISASAYVADVYTINFVTNASGNVAYNVIGTTSGQVIPPLPLDGTLDAPNYESGDPIIFNGVETSIIGTPVDGDNFSISPEIKKDIFTTLSNLKSALQSDTVDESDVAKILNEVTRSIQDIDQAFDNMTNFRAKVGARLNTAESQRETNESFLLEVQSTISATEDLDYLTAITELESRAFALEAAQASFSRIMGLSLFNEI